ncbi:MAG: T9SS type A sorting domain-containing protein [Bacteroidota bacterium]
MFTTKLLKIAAFAMLLLGIPLYSQAQFSETFFVSSNTQANIGALDVQNWNDIDFSTFPTLAGDADGIHYDEDEDVLYQLNRTDNVIQAYSNVMENIRRGMMPPLTATSTSDFSNGREITVSKNKLVVAQDDNGGNGGNRLLVYNISPTSITLEQSFAVGINLWGLHATDKTLYAVVDNSNQLAVFNNFFAQEGRSVAPTRVVEIEGIVRTHGLTYHAEFDQMFLTDVGSAGDATDGAFVLINHFSSVILDGFVSQEEQVRVAGNRTFLGNPVDIAYSNRTAMIFVAERANGGGRILGFRFPTGARRIGNVAPVYNQLFTGASAIAVGNNEDEVITDNNARKRVFLSSNTAGLVGVYSLRENGEEGFNTFCAAGQDADGIHYNEDDDRIYQVNRSQNVVNVYGLVDWTLSSNVKPSVIAMSGTGSSVFNFVNGRGIAVSEERIVVAQDATSGNGGNRFAVYEIDDNDIELRRTYNTTINLWGIHATDETLYAVADNTNQIARFDNFFDNFGSGLIRPNALVSVEDLVRTHGIHYAAERDMMLLTDIGLASSATDGAFVVIRNYSQAARDGVIRRNEQIRVSGNSTLLGNPVDLTYCEFDDRVYIAERANGGGRMLAFPLPGIGSDGGNIMPIANVLFPGASSVAVGDNEDEIMERDLFGSRFMVPATEKSAQLEAYPNPTTEILHVQWQAASPTSQMILKIIDIKGKIVHRQVASAAQGLNTYKLSVGHLSNGLYKIVVEGETSQTVDTFVKH